MKPLEAYATPAPSQANEFWQQWVSDDDYAAFERIIAAAEGFAARSISPEVCADVDDGDDEIPAEILAYVTRAFFSHNLIVDYVRVLLT